MNGVEKNYPQGAGSKRKGNSHNGRRLIPFPHCSKSRCRRQTTGDATKKDRKLQLALQQTSTSWGNYWGKLNRQGQEK